MFGGSLPDVSMRGVKDLPPPSISIYCMELE